MTPYKDTNRDSGIEAYEYGDDWITVKFDAGSHRHYKYQASKIGQAHIDRMKKLADSGNGLNSYINTHRDVQKGYSDRW